VIDDFQFQYSFSEKCIGQVCYQLIEMPDEYNWPKSISECTALGLEGGVFFEPSYMVAVMRLLQSANKEAWVGLKVAKDYNFRWYEG